MPKGVRLITPPIRGSRGLSLQHRTPRQIRTQQDGSLFARGLLVKLRCFQKPQKTQKVGCVKRGKHGTAD